MTTDDAAGICERNVWETELKLQGRVRNMAPVEFGWTTHPYISSCHIYTYLNNIAANSSKARVQLHKYQTALDLREVSRQ